MKAQEYAGKAQPYIGVTGLRTREDVAEISNALLEMGFDETMFGKQKVYTAMLGFSVSRKRLDDMPYLEDRTDLAAHVPRWLLPMMHYHDWENADFFGNVKHLFTITSMYRDNYCRAVQLNIAWPALSDMEKLLEQFPEMKVVLQLPPQATANLPIDKIVERTKEYAQFVTYVLVDSSRGKGIDYTRKDIEMALALEKALPDTQIGIAGGLSPENVADQIIFLHKLCIKGYFCIDSQGKLKENKVFSSQRAIEYLKNATEAFNLFWP